MPREQSFQLFIQYHETELIKNHETFHRYKINLYLSINKKVNWSQPITIDHLDLQLNRSRLLRQRHRYQTIQ